MIAIYIIIQNKNVIYTNSDNIILLFRAKNITEV